MMPSKPLSLSYCGAIFLAGWLALSAASALAQDRFSILASHDPEGTTTTDLKRIHLRPNIDQKIYFFVQNQGMDDKKDVSVKMLKVLPGNRTEELGSAALSLAKADGKIIPVTFKAPAVPVPATPPVPPPAPATATPAAPPPPPGIELEGSPFKLEIQVLDNKGIELAKAQPEVVILEPKSYIKVVDVKFKGGVDNELRVQLKADRDTFTGPVCPVELDLQPARIPGLDTAKKMGVYRQLLAGPDKDVTLVARKLTFNSPTGDGTFYITVDGCKRAYIFRTNFASPGGLPVTPDEVTAVDVRLQAPRYSPPVDKLEITVEPENAAKDSTIEVSLDQGGSVDKATLPTSRQQSVRVEAAGPKGSVLFHSQMKDWIVPLNTAGIYGECMLTTSIEGKRKLDPSSRVTFDPTPPEILTIQGPGKPVKKGAPLTMKASAIDPESDIREAIFFVGHLTADGKILDGAIRAQGKRPEGKETAWTATLEKATAAPGTTEISVQFFNKAGLSAARPTTVLVVEKIKATIEGTVNEGDRLQPGIPVELRDAKGEIKDTTKTDDKGKYIFKEVDPGTYKITAAKSSSGTKGKAEVVVKEDKPLDKKGKPMEDVVIKLTR